MAIPSNRLSTEAVRGDYIAPYDRDMSAWLDYEYGGTALEDADDGLLVQIWRLEYDPLTGDFTVTPESIGSPTVLRTELGVDRVGLAFDQLMRPVLAWLKDGVLYLRWFDPVANQTVTTTIGAADDFRVLLDDPRPIQTQAGSSDVLLFIVRDGVLYYRQQRDRYETERTLATFTLPEALIRSYGRTTRNRIEFEVRLP